MASVVRSMSSDTQARILSTWALVPIGTTTAPAAVSVAAPSRLAMMSASRAHISAERFTSRQLSAVALASVFVMDLLSSSLSFYWPWLSLMGAPVLVTARAESQLEILDGLSVIARAVHT